MKERKKMGKVPKALLLAWSIIFIMCCLIIGYYVYTMGNAISKNSGNWGDFGSLLSGTFGMLASFTAIGTLIVVILQLRQQSEITERQIQAIEFDRYDRHRRIFFERLEGAEAVEDSAMKIYNKEELYKQIFYNNSPLICDVIMPMLETGRNDDLYAIKLYFNELRDKIKNPNKIDMSFMHELKKLQHLMKIIPSGVTRDGDLIYADEATIINMYDFQKTVDIFVRTFNSILEYSGNTKLDHKHYKINSGGNVTKAMIYLSHKINTDKNIKRLYVVTEHRAIMVYEDIYVYFKEHPHIIERDNEAKRLHVTSQKAFNNIRHRSILTAEPRLILNICKSIKSMITRIQNDIIEDKINPDDVMEYISKLAAWHQGLDRAAREMEPPSKKKHRVQPFPS